MNISVEELRDLLIPKEVKPSLTIAVKTDKNDNLTRDLNINNTIITRLGVYSFGDTKIWVVKQ